MVTVFVYRLVSNRVVVVVVRANYWEVAEADQGLASSKKVEAQQPDRPHGHHACCEVYSKVCSEDDFVRSENPFAV
jgi:hypothetical protein